jgi:hypothetical protein
VDLAPRATRGDTKTKMPGMARAYIKAGTKATVILTTTTIKARITKPTERPSTLSWYEAL